MTAAFPSWISQVVVRDNYAEAPDTNVVSFKPEVGPAILRRRSSLSQDVVPCTMWLSSSDWQDLLAFFRTTLTDGTQPFTWVHPRSKVAGTFQFEGGVPPKVTSTLGPIFVVQFSLRLLSGGVVLPTVLAISPNNGTTDGGTPVTITGTNFNGATGVTIGGVAATGVTVVSATTITATTPAGSVGVVDVDVTTPRGTGIGSALFTY